MNYTCPVCGFDGLDEPPYSSSGYGQHEICPCCGFQFGVSDDNAGIGFHEWRKTWIDRGMSWEGSSDPPEGWNPKEQLRNLTNPATGPHNVLNDSLLDND